MRSEYKIYEEYPEEITNKDGMIFAIRLSECPFPEGTGLEVNSECAPFTVDTMCQTFNDPEHTGKWGWCYLDPETKTILDNMVEEEELEPNRWYFLDWWDVEDDYDAVTSASEAVGIE